MKFNFDLFTVLAEKPYNFASNWMSKYPDMKAIWGTYTFDTVLAVFRYYFQTYEDVFGEPHPPIRKEQIQRIISCMPQISSGSVEIDIEPEVYEHLIYRHFQTRYRNCDYNINHFFSGDIRAMRYHEIEGEIT